MSSVGTPVERRTGRPPLWRDVRVIRAVLQVLFLLAVAGAIWYLVDTLLGNLRRQGLRTDWDWLRQPAGFAIADTEFRSTQSFVAAYLVGARNTIYISAIGIVLASLLGLVVGVVLGAAAMWLFARLPHSIGAFAPVASVAMAALTFGTADQIGGSGFLAVYLVGLAVGSTPSRYRRQLVAFHEGLAVLGYERDGNGSGRFLLGRWDEDWSLVEPHA